MHAFVTELHADFLVHKNQEKAYAMQQYMKNKFPFLGIQKPLRTILIKPYLTIWKTLHHTTQIEISTSLWNLKEREFQYACITLHQSSATQHNHQLISHLIDLVGLKSWWDTVDILSANLIGKYCLKHYETYIPVMLNYSKDSNIWYNRLALLHQLKYKKLTNLSVLNQTIVNCKHKEDFFIQKAIGWLLREYAKSNPEFVINYLNEQTFSNLATREALKHLK